MSLDEHLCLFIFKYIGFVLLYETLGSRRSSLNEDEQQYAIANVDTKVNEFSSSAKQLQEILKNPTCKLNIWGPRPHV